MAFERTSQKNKNQFSARLVSNKTQSMICWAHLTDDMARKVFGVMTVADIPYAAAAEKLPVLLNSNRVSVIVTDMTTDLEPVAIEDF